jgi:hypothetical protein
MTFLNPRCMFSIKTVPLNVEKPLKTQRRFRNVDKYTILFQRLAQTCKDFQDPQDFFQISMTFLNPRCMFSIKTVPLNVEKPLRTQRRSRNVIRTCKLPERKSNVEFNHTPKISLNVRGLTIGVIRDIQGTRSKSESTALFMSHYHKYYHGGMVKFIN